MLGFAASRLRVDPSEFVKFIAAGGADRLIPVCVLLL
jgi:hypothetical protein